ncbi:hypothetical protein K456DRAFT_490414 [Colletotrichum gloeosporioides 23]|nr:hypothetical protein K456DRAFT_490414 [Colletotrichum gloeosporioides 23]
MERLIVESQRLDDKEEETKELFQKQIEALQKVQAEVNEVLAKLDHIRKAKRIVFKKGCKETSVVAGEDEVLEALSAESSLVLEAQAIGASGVLDFDIILSD